MVQGRGASATTRAPAGIGDGNPGGRLAPRARWAPLSLDAAVVGFALWTVWYHGALLIGGWAATTAAMFVVLIAVLAAQTWLGMSRLRRRRSAGATTVWVEPGTPRLVIAVAVAAAALSLIANRPDADDVFYVNRSSAIEAMGVLPLRDTMFADQLFAMISSQFPPVASFEALIGTIADVLGVPAASITYYAVPPLGSFLAVLALWRLIASWEVSQPLIACAVALTYLMLGGAFHASYGNTWIERMWQGKILFISILVPVLLVYLIRWLRWGRRADATLGMAAAVAGVGLTSTAIFVLPAFFAVAAIAALVLGPRKRALPLLIPLTYVVVLGLAWLLLSRANAASGGETGAGSTGDIGPTTADIVTKVLGTGPYLLAGLAAALLGWAAIRQRHARVLVALAVLAAALAVSPLGLAAMDGVGLPPSLRWRMMWLVPVPALLGALTVGVGARLGRTGAAAAGSAVAVGIVLVGLPIWSPANGVTLGWPMWKWPADVQREQERIASVARPGDVVGASESIGAMVTAVSGDIWSVNPRGNYTSGMDNQEGFCADERFTVSGFAEGSVAFDAEVAASLGRLGVDVLVLPIDQPVPEEQLSRLSYRPTNEPGILRRVPGPAGVDGPASCSRPSN